MPGAGLAGQSIVLGSGACASGVPPCRDSGARIAGSLSVRGRAGYIVGAALGAAG